MAVNELKVLLTGDASRLSASLQTASGRLKSFGSNVKNIGASLQRVAVPLALAGGAAIKMGADFDKSMTQIKSLVGVASDEVDKMGEAARQMAVATGNSSQDAAEALFFITSAGLRGSEAMDVLNASLKASAVGLGETKVVADLATSAMNAYGSNVLSASQATDVMVAAVREGKLEAEELAGSMGRVLPIASAMGVSFNEVGAAFAALSRTGTNAAEAATQVRGIFSSLLKPTTQAEEALTAMGLSSAGLRKSLKEDGLLATLEILKENFEGNDTAAQTVFGNVRALSGVMDLLGANVQTTRDIFESMNKTQGATAKAFETTAKSASFQLKAGLNQVKESFSQLGAVMLQTFLPLIQKVSGFLTSVFNGFQKLDASTQQLVMGIGAIVVALPTLISLFGTLTTIVGALLSPVGLIAAGLAAVAYTIYTNWSEVAPVIVGLYNQFVDLYNGSESLRVAIGLMGAVFKSVFIGVKATVDSFVNTFSTMWNLIKEFSEKGVKGSFGDILEQGFDNGIEIAKQAGKDIGDTFSDSIATASANTLEKKTVEQLNGALTNAAAWAQNKITGLFKGGGGVSAGGGSTQAPEQQKSLGETFAVKPGAFEEAAVDIPSPITYTTEQMEVDMQKMESLEQRFINANQRMRDIANAVGNEVGNAFNQMGQGIVNSLGLADTGFQGFVKGLVGTITKLIAMMLSASISQSIAGATASGTATGPAAVFTTPAFIATAVGGVLSAFAAIPKFADGGIVSGPTMGIMGEYAGAKSNPEVIAPLDKLQNMIGGASQNSNVNVSGQFKIQGQDLVMALQKADKTRSRIK